MNMEKNIYGAYDACLMKRLGQAYNGSRVYREAARAEDALVKQFREGLTEEQQRQLDDCHNAMCYSSSVCEQLAYRQGMRDMIALLYGE